MAPHLLLSSPAKTGDPVHDVACDSLEPLGFLDAPPARGMTSTCVAMDAPAYAAFGNAALACAKAQSSQGVSASTSSASTVAPHQMRNPGGASR